nr:hypothetical protein [Chromobacterium sp. ASV5]
MAEAGLQGRPPGHAQEGPAIKARLAFADARPQPDIQLRGQALVLAQEKN